MYANLTLGSKCLYSLYDKGIKSSNIAINFIDIKLLIYFSFLYVFPVIYSVSVRRD